MAFTEYPNGGLWSTTLPSGQRTYYEQLLLDTIRMKSILMPFCAVKEDFAARDTGQITYTEVLDAAPNWNPVSEQSIWLKGSYIDSRTVNLNLSIYGGVMRLSDFAELTNYWNNGDLRGLIRGKLGQMVVDELDILARNAFLAHPLPFYSKVGATTRTDLAATDTFPLTMVEDMRTDLEEHDIPGVMTTGDGDGQTIVCVTTPRVIHDIRQNLGNSAAWNEVNNYTQTGRKFTSEVGTWDGVRFVKTNRNWLRNYGNVVFQTTLVSDTVEGQGSAATVDTIYAVGQTGSTRTIPCTAVTGFAVGDYVTIHDKTTGLGAGKPPVETDGTQETVRIVAIDTVGKTISLAKPLLKPHVAGDFVTKGVDIHTSMFMGGPSVVYGVGERPNIMVLPRIDDLQMIQRFSWRGFFKFQQFRPEFLRVVFSGGASQKSF
jgi:N4-gp56 family major capsid protein